MERFSVIYLQRRQYHHICCSTQQEAEAALADLSADSDTKPIGIYDAKTELFQWEPTRQQQYDKANIEKQGKLGEQISLIAQKLRNSDHAVHDQPNSLAQILQLEEFQDS